MENKAIAGGTTDEYLSLVWQKEIELDQKLDKVKREAKKIIENAERQAGEMVRKAQKAQDVLYKSKKMEAEKTRKQELAAELKQEELSPKQLSQAEQEEVAKLKQKASANLDKAVELILQKVLA